MPIYPNFAFIIINALEKADMIFSVTYYLELHIAKHCNVDVIFY